MKAIVASVVLILALTSAAPAESLHPEEVVRALVRAAHDNDLQGVVDTADLVKIAAHPRHARTPRDLIQFLKGIDQAEIRFQEQARSGWPESTVVRMAAPVSIDFDLALVKATTDTQEDHYVVVAVHP
jgi:hypothetical protein